MRNYLKSEDKFYNKHKNEYLQKYLGKIVVIHQNELQGVFDNDDDAITFTKEKKFPRNTFMIKKVVENEPVMQFATVGF